MEPINLNIHGIAELRQEELAAITGGDAYRVGQLVGYGLGFIVGGAFSVMALLL